MFQTGGTETDKRPIYPAICAGMHASSEKAGEVPVNLQAATISAEKPGFSEKNLCRQGNCRWPPGFRRRTIQNGESAAARLPNRPVSLDFVLVPAATIEVEFPDAKTRAIAERTMWLSGKELPPSCSILSGGKRDAQGRLQFENVPPNFAWWFAVQVESRREVRSPSLIFPKAEKYRVRLHLRREAASGLDLLEVVSVKNAKGEEVREQVTASGEVIDPTGKPIAGVTVYLREWSTLRSSEDPRGAVGIDAANQDLSLGKTFAVVPKMTGNGDGPHCDGGIVALE